MTKSSGAPAQECKVSAWSGWGFGLGILAIAVLTFIAPIAEPKVMLYAGYARTKSMQAAVVGNSIIDHVSLCDRDKRTLSDMLTDRAGQHVLDLSYGGQSLSEAMNFAALALRNRSIQHVVVTISLPELIDWDSDALQKYLFFLSTNPGLAHESLLDRIRSGAFWTGRPGRGIEAFVYNGKAYPDYSGIKTYYFSREKELMSCPETNGRDEDFSEAYYNHIYTDSPIQEKNLAVVISLAKQAQERGQDLRIVIMPIDFELMRQLNPSIEQRTAVRVASVVAALRSQGIAAIDLSRLLPNAAFSDRWCACGHLLDEGRRQVANRIAETLQSGRSDASRYSR